jgi:hypothetical protein
MWSSDYASETSHGFSIAASSRLVRSTRFSSSKPGQQHNPLDIDTSTAVKALDLLRLQTSNACGAFEAHSVPLSLSWPTSNLADQRLLQHYIECTSSRLLPLKRTRNPFIDHILPVACNDSTTLHALLAISAAHLSFRDRSSSVAAQTHYIVCIRAVRHKVACFLEKPDEGAVALLTCVLLLCLFESVNGDTEGRLFKHLRASTSLVSYIWKKTDLSQDRLQKILIEQFLYLSFIHGSLRFSNARDRQPVEALRQLSDAIALNFTAQDIDGMAFGRSYQIYKVLPEIRAFAEMVPKTLPRYLDPDIQMRFDLLESKVLDWEIDGRDRASEEDLTAGLLVQLGVLVYLYAVHSGPGRPPETILPRIQLLINQFVTRELQLDRDAPCRALLLWPMIIVGSCALKRRHRAHIQYVLLHSHHMMYATTSVVRYLQLLWNDERFGDSWFGPYGLEHVAQRYGVDLSLA